MAGEVDIKVNIPPRRRSATLGVQLDEGHEARAVVNVKSVRLTVSATGRYGTSQAITIPRDVAALANLQALIDAVQREVTEQEEWAARDAAERAAEAGA
jgi:antitoxin component of MazEF toxin-antitoxin module